MASISALSGSAALYPTVTKKDSTSATQQTLTTATGGAPDGATSASSSTTYEAADKDEDGTVSETERAAYQQTTAYLNMHPDSGASAKGAAAFARAPASSLSTQA